MQFDASTAAHWAKLSLSDTVMFATLQVAVVGAVVFCAVAQRVQPKAGVGMAIERGEPSLKMLLGFYLAVTAILTGLSLSVEAYSAHRTANVLLDVFATSYVCFVNGWSRNRLIGVVAWVANLERR